jgi:hypothetical protein
MDKDTLRNSVAHSDGNGGLIIETRQDVTGIIEQNRKEYSSHDERSKWSDNLFGNKVASIPLTVIDDLNKKGIMRGFHVLDEKRFKSWLNDSDNRFFRTRPGII